MPTGSLFEVGTGTDSERIRKKLTALCSSFPARWSIIQQGTTAIQNPTGNPGMSRGGSGDVLAGMIAAFAAQGLSPYDAACAGAYLHGLAGDFAAARYSEQAMLPQDLLRCLPEVFLKLEQERTAKE
ncbi:MAG: NAD(P)H-hydrate dehydratase [Ruminococcus sp.]|nr:NAD(P)H-hydrate dehydratase [Ruminococcus sp.]